MEEDSLRDDEKEQRLIAYVVPATGVAPTVSELRHALALTLPEYMMPSAFVFLETLPLSPTGKIDRRALRETAMFDSGGTQS